MADFTGNPYMAASPHPLDVLSMLGGAMSKRRSALTAMGHIPPATVTPRAVGAGALLANALLNNPYTQKALIGRYGNADAGPPSRVLAAVLASRRAMREGQRGQ